MGGMRRLGAIVGAALLLLSPATRAQDALGEGRDSGLPLPRFVSLSSAEVNVRVGPSVTHKVKWKFIKSGLPVEIVREFGNWRRVRDSDGEEGWVHGSLLSGRRTVLVSPWSPDENVPLRSEPRMSATPTAFLEPFVMAEVKRCDGSWCSISGPSFSGLVPQRMLWGVYPKEHLD